MWIWLVLLYGVFKGLREICKKKALEKNTSIEVLLIYTFVSFLLVIPDMGNAFGMPVKFYFLIAIKSFVIFLAWILSFKAIKKLPLSLYGVLDLSRVLFATTLAMAFLGERLTLYSGIGLVLVCVGLLLLKVNPFKKKDEGAKKDEQKVATVTVIIALISCLLNAVSGFMDKILMKDLNSSQLQFWYMLYLVAFYVIYALVAKEKVDIKSALKNRWIWILAILFVIADRALFIANGFEESKITVMTLIKQSGCIVTIIGGKLIFKEKNIAHKLICAAVIITGIVLGVM